MINIVRGSAPKDAFQSQSELVRVETAFIIHLTQCHELHPRADLLGRARSLRFHDLGLVPLVRRGSGAEWNVGMRNELDDAVVRQDRYSRLSHFQIRLIPLSRGWLGRRRREWMGMASLARS